MLTAHPCALSLGHTVSVTVAQRRHLGHLIHILARHRVLSRLLSAMLRDVLLERVIRLGSGSVALQDGGEADWSIAGGGGRDVPTQRLVALQLWDPPRLRVRHVVLFAAKRKGKTSEADA